MGEFSYEQLFDILRRERAREELQELEPEFYADAARYTKQLEEQIRSHDPLDTQADAIRTQLINSKKLLRELYDRREKKILFLALNKARTGSNLIDTSSVIDSERPLFEELLAALKKQREEIAPRAPNSSQKTTTSYNKPLSSSTPQSEPSQEESSALKSGQVRVKVTAAVPKFLGANGETHGPYDPGSEVALPERIARILIRKGRAEHA